MVLTRTTGNAVDNYLTAIEANGSTPIHYVEIDIDGTNKFRFVSGDRPLFTDQSDGPYANSVIAVQPIDATLDPLKREYQVGSADIIFADDGEIRRINQTHRLYGKKVEIKLTEQSLAENSTIAFANRTVFQGVLVIHDVVPQENGTISVTCEGWNTLSRVHDVVGEYTNQHPLELIESLIDVGGTIASNYLDRTTLDPQDAAHSGITHYNCSTVNLRTHHNVLPILLPSGTGQAQNPFNHDQSLREDEKLKSDVLINDLLFILQAGFLQDETGKVELFRYDSAKSIDRQLTEDDIKSFQPLETYADLTNDVVVSLNVADTGHLWRWRQIDTTSQSAYALPGETKRINQLTVDSRFLNGAGVMVGAANGANQYLLNNTTNFDLSVSAGVSGVTGGRFTGSTALEVPAWARVDGTHKAIFQIFAPSTGVRSGGRIVNGQYVRNDLNYTETISVDNIEAVNPAGVRNYTYGPDRAGPELAGTVTRAFPTKVRCTISERGLYASLKPGATASGDAAPIVLGANNTCGWDATNGGVYAYDVTLAAAFVDAVLTRFAHGCPRARVIVGLRHYDLQIGDFITVADSTYLNHQQDGADGTVVWEITSKEIDIDDAEIRLSLAWVRDGVAPATSVVVEEEADAVPTGMVAYTGPTVNDFGLPKNVIATDVSLITDALGDLIVTKG